MKLTVFVAFILMISFLFATPGKHVIKKNKDGVYYIYDGNGNLLLKTKDIENNKSAYDIIGDNEWVSTTHCADGTVIVVCRYLGRGCIQHLIDAN